MSPELEALLLAAMAIGLVCLAALVAIVIFA